VLLLVLGIAPGCRSTVPEPDPANELPFGFLDEPKAGAQVGRQLHFRGWALDDGAIREVRVFFDGRFLARSTLNEDRPDVRAAFPQYAKGSDRHGWRVTASLPASVTPGTHTVLAQAVDNLGATRDIGTAQVIVAP